MTIALLTLNVISLVAIGIAILYGAWIPQGAGALGRHLTIALLAVLLAVFAHIMTYFYFIGVGSSIRRAVEEYGTGHEALRESRNIKARAFPWAGGMSLLVMVAFILGGGAHTRALPGWIHGTLGYLTLAFGLAALVAEARLMFQQNRVANDLQRQLVSEN